MFFCNEFHQWHEERKCCGYYGYYNKKKLKPMKQKRDIKHNIGNSIYSFFYLCGFRVEYKICWLQKNISVNKN